MALCVPRCPNEDSVTNSNIEQMNKKIKLSLKETGKTVKVIIEDKK